MHLIAMGANLGAPRANLTAALAALAARGLPAEAVSGWYRTPAYPPGSGPDYVNAAAALRADLPPEAVLAVLHSVEAELGRVRAERWGPRVIDLDLIASGSIVRPDAATLLGWMALTGDAQMQTPPGLLLPHPRLQDRSFVLVPLADIAAGWRHPLTWLTVAQMRDALPPADISGVVRLPD